MYIKIYIENSENSKRESKAESRKPCGWWLATEIKIDMKIEFRSNGAGNGWGSLIGPDPARVLTQHTNTQKRVRFLWGFIYIS